MISIKDYTFQYGDTEQPALKGINLHIEKGEFVGIIGPSGAGKSTLLSSINGIVPHYYTGDFYGSVTVCGLDTVNSGCVALSRHVGSVLQDPEAQIVTSYVEDEIAFSLENFNVPAGEIDMRITEALELSGIPHLRKRDTAGLSGGQKQRVVVAAAIALRPEILVLDEPTSELDPMGSQMIFETLAKLNQDHNMTIIIVEQKIMLLSHFSKRMITMVDGEIMTDMSTIDTLKESWRLIEMGINCPRVVSLARMLEEEGLYNGTYPRTVEEAATMVREVTRP
ncbi:MAG: energy-coupling factor ABC transporter ATP-binding protein [Oscillospiraceae bacterium]|nr:energy-coupling factor ABC transporter ATP-binding protein [Oscillospiraceae bacterium]